MSVNKVIYYGEVLVDMTRVTVKPENLSKGETALDASGKLITGAHECEEAVLQTKTVTPATSAQTVKPDSGYDGLSQVTVNAMPTATQATPSISVSSGGLITASATQGAGYVSAGTKSATKQLTTQAAQTITPGTADKTIASGRYLTGTQTIKGDANLVADNIKSGVSIFGVAGTYEGSGGGGGAGVDTCTFVLTTHLDEGPMIEAREGGYIAAVYRDGTAGYDYKPYNSSYPDMPDAVIENVICGTVVMIYLSGVMGTKYTNCELLENHAGVYSVIVTAPNGGTATFSVG